MLSTGDQIRRLVQAFLDARSLVIPKPRRPQPRVVAEDSQESQYDYDQFDLDLDDPELLAALGENLGDPEAIQNKEKDKIVCEVSSVPTSRATLRDTHLRADHRQAYLACYLPIGVQALQRSGIQTDWRALFRGRRSLDRLLGRMCQRRRAEREEGTSLSTSITGTKRNRCKPH